MNRLERLKGKAAMEYANTDPVIDIEIAFEKGFETASAEYEKIIAELEGALEFYGSTANWTSLSTKIEYDVFAEDDLKSVVIGEDEQGVIAVKMAGAKARLALLKLKEFRGGE